MMVFSSWLLKKSWQNILLTLVICSSSDELESGYLSLGPSSSENNTTSSVSLSLP